MELLLNKIKQLQQLDHPIIVAIDGKCGSGKTTLAASLQQQLQANVIHMDDFFLPLHMRQPARFQEIGGNVHYERLAEVLLAIQQQSISSYEALDCQTFTMHTKLFTESSIYIVEGVYAMHPALRSFYSTSMYLHIDEATQYERLQQRETPEKFAMFKEKWIPLENRYFETYAIQQLCEFTWEARQCI